MAGIEQVGIMTELELNKLSAQLQEALGDKAERLPPYPETFFDPSLLHVEQLKWMNSAIELMREVESEEVADEEDEETSADEADTEEQETEATEEGEEQGEEETTPQDEPDTTPEKPVTRTISRRKA